MTRRSPLVRSLAILFATVQLTSPGLSAIADGFLSLRGAGAPLVHVESRTTSSCPEIHGVDCAICRYLSHVAATLPSARELYAFSVELPPINLERGAVAAGGRALPYGRAPPTV